VFAAGAGATWAAGIYLSRSTDVLDERFKLGEAFGGMILLAISGTLPEIAIDSLLVAGSKRLPQRCMEAASSWRE